MMQYNHKDTGCAPGVQMRALQARAVSRPPPRARDSTAATVGLGPLSSKEQKLSLILHVSTTRPSTSPVD